MKVRTGERAAKKHLGLTPIVLNHAAWVTRDVEDTADIYTSILGMALASTVLDEKSRSTDPRGAQRAEADNAMLRTAANEHQESRLAQTQPTHSARVPAEPIP